MWVKCIAFGTHFWGWKLFKPSASRGGRFWPQLARWVFRVNSFVGYGERNRYCRLLCRCTVYRVLYRVRTIKKAPGERVSKRSPSRGRSFLLFPSSKMGAIRYLVRPHFADLIILRSETKYPSQIKQIDFWPVRSWSWWLFVISN